MKMSNRYRVFSAVSVLGAAMLAPGSLTLADDGENSRLERLRQANERIQQNQDGVARPGQQAQRPVRDDEITGPTPLKFEETRFDFGRIMDSAGKVRAEFPFRNGSEKEIEIIHLQASCGCTAGELEQRRYQPGEDGVITVYFDPDNRHGNQNQRVRVHTRSIDGTEAAVATLQVRAEVIRSIEAEPQRVFMMDVLRDEPEETTVSIISRVDGFQIKGIELNNDFFEAEVLSVEDVELTDEEKGVTERVRKAQILIRLTKEGATPGRRNAIARVLYETTESGDHADGAASESDNVINLPLLAEVKGYVHTAPERMVMRALTPGEHFESEIMVSHRLGKTMRILDVDARGQEDYGLVTDLIPRVDDEGNRYFLVRLTGQAPGHVTPLRGTLTLTTNVEGEEVVEIPFYASMRRTAGRDLR